MSRLDFHLFVVVVAFASTTATPFFGGVDLSCRQLRPKRYNFSRMEKLEKRQEQVAPSHLASRRRHHCHLHPRPILDVHAR